MIIKKIIKEKEDDILLLREALKSCQPRELKWLASVLVRENSYLLENAAEMYDGGK